MKRQLLLGIFLIAFAASAIYAQDNPAAAAASREEAEARYQRLSSRIDDLKDAKGTKVVVDNAKEPEVFTQRA